MYYRPQVAQSPGGDCVPTHATVTCKVHPVDSQLGDEHSEGGGAVFPQWTLVPQCSKETDKLGQDFCLGSTFVMFSTLPIRPWAGNILFFEVQMWLYYGHIFNHMDTKAI